MEPRPRSRSIAGFWTQLKLILWKNSILYIHNILGLVCEIALSVLFIGIIVLLIKNSSENYGSNNYKTSQNLVLADLGRRYHQGDIYYYPPGILTETLMQNSLKTIKSINRFSYFGITTIRSSQFSTPTQLNKDQIKNIYAFVSFPANMSTLTEWPDLISYTIYLKVWRNKLEAENTNTFEFNAREMYRNSPEYYCTHGDHGVNQMSGSFNALKHVIDLNLVQSFTKLNLNTHMANITERQFECPSYKNDVMKSAFSFFIPIIISLTYLSTFIVNVSNIVNEKQTQMKEYLKLIGVKPSVIWICWLFRNLVVYFVLSLIITIVLKLEMEGIYSSNYSKRVFLEYTSPVILFTVLFTYSIQSSLLSILVGHLFSNTFKAKIFSFFLYFASLVNFYPPLSAKLYYLLAIVPNYALNFSFQVIYQYERSSKTLDLSNMFQSLFHDSNNNEEFDGKTLTSGGLIISMLFWSAWYIIFSWYIERISPGEFGVKLPHFFPFMPSYWSSALAKKTTVEGNSLLNNPGENDVNATDFFESVSEDMKPTVRISNMSKSFRTGFENKTVVNNMCLDFYENQITGFLGHNGAGKTTVTFMLCGMYEPSSGTAYMLDQDIRTDMDNIRASIGFCPQKSILFDELTVRQHLDLVASIKGFKRSELKAEIFRISSLVELQNSLNKKSKQLSGGMRRRLALAMALIGDSKIIILDEPTSGLDPYNRRTVWDLLRKYKEGRTIILTTHYMDEADALSDRIALMNHGQIKSCGSPIFLKERFGSGYRVTLTKSEDFNKELFENLVHSAIGLPPNIVSNMAQELCIGIRNADKSKLPELLNKIESQKESIGILNYGISTSTVEEVFLKIGNIDTAGDDCIEHDLLNVFQENNEFTPFFSLTANQIKALLIKRFILFKRRHAIAFLTLLLPILVEAFFNTSPLDSAKSVLDMLDLNEASVPHYKSDLSQYGYQNLPYKINSSSPSDVSKISDVEKQLKVFFSINKQIKLEKVPVNQTISEFVKNKQQERIMDLVRNYYGGFELFLDAKSMAIRAEIYYSEMAHHSSSSILNEINGFLLSYYSKNPNKRIATLNTPIPSSLVENFEFDEDGKSTVDNLQCIEGLPFSNYDFINGLLIACLISFHVMNLTREKKCGSKFLQTLSGTSSSIYWIANYLFDFLIYAVICLTIVIALKLVSVFTDNELSEAYLLMGTHPINFFYLLVFLLVASFSWSTLAYLWSFLFESDSISFVVLFGILSAANFFDMIMGYLNYFNLIYRPGCYHHEANCQFTKTQIFSELCRIFYLFCFPNVVVKRAFYGLKISNFDCETKFKIGEKINKAYMFTLTKPGFWIFLIPSITFFVVGNFLLYIFENHSRFITIIENRTKKNKSRITSSEADVLKESNRIKNSNLNTITLEEPFVISGLYKKFRNRFMKKFVAVEDLSFGVKSKECFGLLGLNGAGKTTTLKILTGEERASDGHAFVNGYDITGGRSRADLKLGLCPQYDYLPHFMTVKECLNMFATLRGIRTSHIEKVVEEFIHIFRLTEFRDKLSQNLSGGNKRKLSSAIAFIGRPKTVILDEPTSGMDPAAKRYLWNVIKKARDIGTTIILTTHSMEESEALCTKLAIMVNGQFECFGNPQYLKAKYGKGYTLVIKCKTEHDTKNVQVFIESNLPDACLKECQQETLFYQISSSEENAEDGKVRRTGLSIGYIFNLFELNKVELNLETYSLCQTSLEQVFLLFARKQRNQEKETEKLAEIFLREDDRNDEIEMDLIL